MPEADVSITLGVDGSGLHPRSPVNSMMFCGPSGFVMRKEVPETSDVGDIAAQEVLEAALDKGVLSTSTCSAVDTKEPGKLIAQADGLDIVKKASTRKGRCLMLLACQLSLVPGGQLGELECMDTQTPLLYISFPGGRFRLEGTFAYPKSRYTVLKLGSRQSVQLEHAFEHIIVFSKITWVGSKEDNPNETALPVPEELKKLPKDDSRHTVLFGQGLGADSVTVRGSGQGGAATPSKQRAQPSRRSRGKAARVVDSDESEEAEEEADGDSGDDVSNDAAEDESAEMTPQKAAKTAAKDTKKSPGKRRRAGGKKQEQAGTSGAAETKQKRKSPGQTEAGEVSPPAAKRRASARSSQKPNYTLEGSEDEEAQASDEEEPAPQNDSGSDFSASE